MNEFIERIKTFSKHLTHDIEEMIHDHSSEKIPFTDMPAIIIEHPKTKHTCQKLLENVFHTYELNLFPYFLQLETKGERSEFILQLTISSQEKTIYSYRSYEESAARRKPVSIPAPLWEELKVPFTSGVVH
ncbi:hypothetical protein FZC79_00285 [Rossellomorea vietnamensis]|uniref:Uncharacterized protein n=2 Tax=Rossellomorea TaxID=2837508 RepID=A0A5D4KJ32_9BACI|nr:MULTISPECIES: hypothetical protein [Rossellomorea]TYR77297.1 hypothetical protein FZC79_00285 [Rossellomorea vietnamensis]TYS78133.1 hypothetical protein FZC80_12935 [Rossellomorea aquimaris]